MSPFHTGLESVPERGVHIGPPFHIPFGTATSLHGWLEEDQLCMSIAGKAALK